MKSALLLIAAILIILLLPASLGAINDFRMTDYSEPHIIATTNLTTAPVTLTQTLFNASVTNVALSSNNTNDAPLPLSYVSATKVLTVDGLVVSSSRTLIVTYKIDALADYVGAAIAVTVWPIFLILGVIGLIVGAVYNATRHGD